MSVCETSLCPSTSSLSSSSATVWDQSQDRMEKMDREERPGDTAGGQEGDRAELDAECDGRPCAEQPSPTLRYMSVPGGTAKRELRRRRVSCTPGCGSVFRRGDTSLRVTLVTTVRAGAEAGSGG